MFHYTFRELPKNLPLMIKKQVQEVPDTTLQASKNKEGKFEYFSYQSVYDDFIALAYQFKKMGIQKGSNVALISDNRREWLLTDYALLSLGAADVPRGCDSMGNEIRFIISYADCKTGVFETGHQLNKVLEKADEVPLMKTAIVFDSVAEDIASKAKDCGIELIQFEDLLNKARTDFAANKDAIRSEIEAGMEAIEPNDTATIIFTSGTTGTPKGVMLTHDNYIHQLSVIHNFLPANPGDMWLSVLPVWHSFERLIQYVAPLLKNGLAYSKPVGQILLADMAVIRPQWMCGVPRLWESLAKGVQKAMNKKGGIALVLFNFFVKVGGAFANQKDKITGRVCRLYKKRSRVLDFICGIFPVIFLLPWKLLGDLLVFRKLQAKFGGRLHVAISGGGALQQEIDSFYRAVGLNLLEGYGLTETAPVVSFRNPHEPRPGCVGAIFPTVEVKICKEENGVVTDENDIGPGKKGLIFARGRQVMKGYYKRPDLTEKVIDKDGWFNTGDLGVRTFDNELKITGRAKDTIVLLGGENVEPAVLEAELLTNDLIESVMIVGQDQKSLGALIVPFKDAVEAFAGENGIEKPYEELLKEKIITDKFDEIVKNSISVSNGFRSCEKIGKVALLPKSFEVGVELSAKQEMMRYKIAEQYKDTIAGLF